MRSSSPYFAGQKIKGKGVTKAILSPLPIHTNFTSDYNARSMLRRNYTFIDVGGGVANVLHGVASGRYVAFGALLSLLLYAFIGPFLPEVQRYAVKDIYGVEFVIKAEYSGFIIGLTVISIPLLFMFAVAVSELIKAIKVAKEKPPFRFHRQRREVAMPKWNEQSKRYEVRYCPWELVCAWVEDKNVVTEGNKIAKSVLYIGDDKSDMTEEQLGVSKAILTLDKESAVMEWEAIRRFMEEGISHDGELFDQSKKMTMRRVIEDYCVTKKLPAHAFSLSKRMWWEVSGWRVAVIFYNVTRMFEQKHAFRDPTFEAWSKPINENEWQKPSAALTKYNTWLKRNEYKKGLNILNLGDVKDKYSL
ncbi:hypothetical protein L4C36_14390 [Photobacterium japonica]|uniref:hypothetical protein n=1 Tax=Photobacterium japonica TaxID=2910235 RepID=UPI003D0BBDFF